MMLGRNELIGLQDPCRFRQCLESTHSSYPYFLNLFYILFALFLNLFNDAFSTAEALQYRREDDSE